MRDRLPVVLFASALFSVVSLGAAVPIRIVHTALTCVARTQNPLIKARIEGGPETARVYFRAVQATCGEYYVDMRKSDKDPNVFWTVLPLVSPETSFITYQIRASKAGGPDVVSPWATTAVTPDCSADPLTAQEQAVASNITLGLTLPTQTAVPCGFRCDGITWYISFENILGPNEACRRVLAGLPWYRTPEAIALGAGALLGGIVIDHNRHRTPPSPARP